MTADQDWKQQSSWAWVGTAGPQQAAWLCRAAQSTVAMALQTMQGLGGEQSLLLPVHSSLQALLAGTLTVESQKSCL